MSILENASSQELERLLALYPIANLRRNWPENGGTKEELCASIVETTAFDAMVRFIDANFACCKQHIHVFSRDAAVQSPPKTIAGSDVIFKAKGSHSLYIARVRYNVILKDPLRTRILIFSGRSALRLFPNTCL